MVDFPRKSLIIHVKVRHDSWWVICGIVSSLNKKTKYVIRPHDYTTLHQCIGNDLEKEKPSSTTAPYVDHLRDFPSSRIVAASSEAALITGVPSPPPPMCHHGLSRLSPLARSTSGLCARARLWYLIPYNTWVTVFQHWPKVIQSSETRSVEWAKEVLSSSCPTL